MSLQNAVNLYLSESSGQLQTITVAGLSGDLNLPEGCYIQIRGCMVGTMTVASNCIVVVEQSQLLKPVTIADNSTVTFDASVISDTVDISNSKGTFKNCQFEKAVTFTGSSFDIYVCAFAGTGAGIAASKGSHLTLRAATFSSMQGLTADGDSTISIYNSNFTTQQECIFATTAVINYFGGTLNSSGGTCVRGVSNSKIVLSGIASAIGQVGVINIDSSTVMQMHNSGGINCQNNAITVTGGATLELYQLTQILSLLTVISVSTGGAITISEVPMIRSLKTEAIYINGGTLFGRSLGTIRGMTSAFVSQNSALVTLLGFTEIRADTQICINSGDLDSYTLTNGNLIQADLGTLITGTSGKFIFRDIAQISGKLKEGILLGNNASIDMFNVQEVDAVLTATLQVGNNGQILLSFCPLVQISGQGDAVSLGTNGFFRMTDSGTLLSQKQNAITAGAGTSIEIVAFNTVQAPKGYAMQIDGCQLTLRNGTQVLGGQQGGIRIGGSGGTADIEQVALLDGGLGEALYVNNGILNLTDCARVNAGSNGIHLDTGTVANIIQIPQIIGQQSGLVVKNGSNLTMNGTVQIQGGSAAAVSIDSSEADLVAVTAVTSPAGSLQVANNSKVSIRGTTFDGGDVVTNNSDLTLLSCIDKKNLTSTNTVLVVNRCEFNGMTATITGAVLDAQNTNFAGMATMSQVTIKYVLVTHEDLVTLTDCAGLFLSCSAPAWLNTSGGLLFLGCDGSPSNATPGSIVDVQKGGLIDLKSTDIDLEGAVSMG